MRYFIYTVETEDNQPIPAEIEILTVSNRFARNVKIVSRSFETIKEAEEYAEQLRAIYGLPTGRKSPPGNKRVQCLNDGRIFKNATQAARWNGVTGGEMSKHLNDPQNYPTVRGLRFVRVKEALK